jgi:hypothetical protein
MNVLRKSIPAAALAAAMWASTSLGGACASTDFQLSAATGARAINPARTHGAASNETRVVMADAGILLSRIGSS